MLIPNIKLVMVKEKNHDYKITSSNEVFDVIKKEIVPKLSTSPVEVFGFIGLETNNKIIFIDDSAVGGINESRVHIANIAKKLLLTNSSQVILFHNHPSGNLKASESDINITCKVKEALNYFDIKLLDHLIIGDGDFISFKELGYIN